MCQLSVLCARAMETRTAEGTSTPLVDRSISARCRVDLEHSIVESARRTQKLFRTRRALSAIDTAAAARDSNNVKMVKKRVQEPVAAPSLACVLGASLPRDALLQPVEPPGCCRAGLIGHLRLVAAAPQTPAQFIGLQLFSNTFGRCILLGGLLEQILQYGETDHCCNIVHALILFALVAATGYRMVPELDSRESICNTLVWGKGESCTATQKQTSEEACRSNAHWWACFRLHQPILPSARHLEERRLIVGWREGALAQGLGIWERRREGGREGGGFGAFGGPMAWAP